MKQIMALLGVVLLVGGCACTGDVTSQVRQSLALAQVGYGGVMDIAGKSTDPDVAIAAAAVDGALAIIGPLAYKWACPTPAEIKAAQHQADVAVKAKKAVVTKAK